MPISRQQLSTALSELLQPHRYQDYCPNGLQVEGRDSIARVVTGVTACQALLDAAVAHHADAVLVHHGYFWKSEAPELVGMKARRIRTLIQADINLYAYHLPLDSHPTLGNNAGLGRALGITEFQLVEPDNPSLPLFVGSLQDGQSQSALAQQLEHNSTAPCCQRESGLYERWPGVPEEDRDTSTGPQIGGQICLLLERYRSKLFTVLGSAELALLQLGITPPSALESSRWAVGWQRHWAWSMSLSISIIPLSGQY